MDEKYTLDFYSSIFKNSLMESLGMEILGFDETYAEIKMPIDHRTCRPDGALHGGANMALAETLAGMLGTLAVPGEKQFNVYGVEVNGNHIRRAEGHYVIGKATFLHKGRRTQIVNVEIRDEFGALVTINRITNLVVEPYKPAVS